jgi:hypothetical protein
MGGRPPEPLPELPPELLPEPPPELLLPEPLPELPLLLPPEPLLPLLPPLLLPELPPLPPSSPLPPPEGDGSAYAAHPVAATEVPRAAAHVTKSAPRVDGRSLMGLPLFSGSRTDGGGAVAR